MPQTRLTESAASVWHEQTSLFLGAERNYLTYPHRVKCMTTVGHRTHGEETLGWSNATDERGIIRLPRSFFVSAGCAPCCRVEPIGGARP